MQTTFNEGALTLLLKGRIDSANVAEFEQDISTELSFCGDVNIAFDAKELEYISSAGLRVFLKLKKKLKKPIYVFNVSDEVFDIFSVTGFTEILEVEREMRRISLKDCRKVSSALNGEIFAVSEDEIIKVYDKSVPLSRIRQERSYAQTAMIAGIPTLIPFDVVSSDKGYGIVFEMGGAESLAYVIQHDHKRVDLYGKMLAALLREMHGTEIPEGKFPDIKERYREWISELGDDGDAKTGLFSRLIDSIADSPAYVHGDVNLNSVMVKDGELLLMDMAGSARGHALFDLQSLFASLVAIEKTDPGYCRKTFGLSSEVCLQLWNSFFKEYMTGRAGEIEKMNELLLKYFVLKESVLNQVERKHQIRGYK